MEAFINSEILSGIAGRILDELYEAALAEPRIMVCNWSAYAVLEAYRQYARIIEDIPIPDIESCFSGIVTPVELRFNRKWRELMEWHECHRQKSCETFGEESYKKFLDQSELRLRNYTLCL